MSASSQRRPNDAYFTPERVAEQIVDDVLPTVCANPLQILEPSAGEGVCLRPLRRAYPSATVHAIDMRLGGTGWATALDVVWELGDFLDPDYLTRHDLIVGNPPFSLALEFARKSLVLAPVVVFVVKLSFLSAIKRYHFWREHPPARVWVLPKRPSFTGDGRSDVKTDYCVVCWQRGAVGTLLHWLPPPGRV